MKNRILKRRFLLTAVAGLMMSLGTVSMADAETKVPHTFTSGATANAAAVNENFQSLADAIDNVPAASQGPTGPQGQTGATGSQGLQGLQGPSAGNTGATGVGPVGPAGVAGANGTNGAEGMTGPAGPQGSKGLNWAGAWDILTDYVVDEP